MKKYGFNSGVIGSDQRSAATGVISQQKFALERSNGRLKPANTIKIPKFLKKTLDIHVRLKFLHCSIEGER